MIVPDRMVDTSDLDQQIEQLRRCEIIKESDVKILCAKAREILGKSRFRCRPLLFFHQIFKLNIYCNSLW